LQIIQEIKKEKNRKNKTFPKNKSITKLEKKINFKNNFEIYFEI